MVSTEQVLEQFKKVHNKYDYSLVEYVNNTTNVKIICPIHGTFEQTPKNHKKGCGCPECGRNSTTNSKKSTTETFIKKAKDIHGNTYDYSLVEYIDSATKVSIQCIKHGTFLQSPRDHLSGKGCIKCGGRCTDTTESFIKKAKNIHGNAYDYSLVEYVNNNTKVKIICPIHGEFEQSPKTHKKGSGCIKCGESIRLGKWNAKKDVIKQKTQKTFKRKYGHNHPSRASIEHALHRLNDKEWLISQHHTNSKTLKNISEELDVHLSTVSNYMKKWDIPIKYNFVSDGELELVDYIQSIYDGEVQTSVRDLIHPYEVDVVLPDLKLCFEYNGLYYHSEKFDKCDKYYHKNKTDLLLNNGYNLIHIFEDDWLSKKHILKSLIKNRIGKDSDKIYARKLNVRIPPKEEVNVLLNNYHIQGSVGGSLVYGLYNDNELVSVMLFKNRGNGVYELNRFASSVRVVGGFSKLLSHFKRNVEWAEIISFADRCWSEGNVYVKNGFESVETLEPDYKYVINDKRVHKFNYRHASGLRDLPYYDKNLSEHQNMMNHGYYRIYDCGKYKFAIFNDK